MRLQLSSRVGALIVCLMECFPYWVGFWCKESQCRKAINEEQSSKETIIFVLETTMKRIKEWSGCGHMYAERNVHLIYSMDLENQNYKLYQWTWKIKIINCILFWLLWDT